jgi:hypothetical protein
MVERFGGLNMQDQNILMYLPFHICVNSSGFTCTARSNDRRSPDTFAGAVNTHPGRSLARAALAAVVVSVALSGCGTFCGLAGGSGGGFGGGCSTGVRF